MERVINIDIQDGYDLVEDYDKTKVSRELIDYIIEVANEGDSRDTFKIVVDKKNNFDHDSTKMIRDGLEREYLKAKKAHSQENKKQLFDLVVGVTFIYISTLINVEILEEILLLGGWVPLWEAIELELFYETKEQSAIKLLKKLKDCEIIEK